MKARSLEAFRDEQLRDEELRREYESMEPEFSLSRGARTEESEASHSEGTCGTDGHLSARHSTDRIR